MRKFNSWLLSSLGILALTVGCAQVTPTASIADPSKPIDDPSLLPQKLAPNQVIQVPYDQIQGLSVSNYQTQRFGGRGGIGGFGGRGFGGRGFGGVGNFGRWGGANWGGRYWGRGWGGGYWGGAYLNNLAFYPYGGYYYPYYLNAGYYYPYWSTPYYYGAGYYNPYFMGAGAYPYYNNYAMPGYAYPPYAANSNPQVNVLINK